MATITMSTGSGASKYQFRITYSYTQDQYANTSTIDISKVEFNTGGNYVGGASKATYFGSLTVKFGGSSGTQILYRSTAYAYITSKSTWFTMTNATASTHTGTVTHNHNGSKSGTFYISTTLSGGGMGSSGSVSATSGTVTLTTITRLFTITYDKGENGTGTNTTATKTYGVDLTLEGAIFTRAGYVQTGWSTTDGGSKDYNLGGTYSSNANRTFYPYWEQAGFNIYQALNGTVGQVTAIYRVTNGTVEQVTEVYKVDSGTVTQI